MAKTIQLIHWNRDEGLERRRQLEAHGHDVQFEFGDGPFVLRRVKAGVPDAVVIDLSRLPSHGREVGLVLRRSVATRHVPLVFADGAPEKVAQTRALLPDATYTTWRGVKTALRKAINKPIISPVVPSDTLSAKPTVEKLGVKAGHKVAVLGSPKGFVETLKPLPPRTTFTARPERAADLFLCFARSARELSAHFATLSHSIDSQTLWMMWPKKTSGVRSDLDGNVVRNTGLAAGWVDFKVCSVDAIWSGLAFKRKKSPGA